MADSGLTVVTGSGDQASNSGSSSLQPGTQSQLGNANGSSFQPSLGSDQLTSNQGISLTPKQLNTISLSQTSSSGQTKSQEPAHHFNPLLLIIAIVLFLVAIAMFAYTSKTGKDYNN